MALLVSRPESIAAPFHGAQFTTNSSLNKPISASSWTYTALYSRISGLPASLQRAVVHVRRGRVARQVNEIHVPVAFAVKVHAVADAFVESDFHHAARAVVLAAL